MHSVFERNEKEGYYSGYPEDILFYQAAMGIFWSPGISMIRV
jgi:hypothetical protein